MRTILLDGFMGSQSRMERFRGTIGEVTGAPSEIWRYDTAGSQPLARYADLLAGYILGLGENVALVGYSMGGLVARSCCGGKAADRILCVATVNTPHGGTLAAHLLPLRATMDMRPRSRFLTSLDEMAVDTPHLSVWCPCDLMVVPGSSARWKGSEKEITCHVPGHIWPLYSRSIQLEVSRWLSGYIRKASASSEE